MFSPYNSMWIKLHWSKDFLSCWYKHFLQTRQISMRRKFSPKRGIFSVHLFCPRAQSPYHYFFCFTDQKRLRCSCFIRRRRNKKRDKVWRKETGREQALEKKQAKSAKQGKVNQNLTPRSACDPEVGENYCGHCMWVVYGDDDDDVFFKKTGGNALTVMTGTMSLAVWSSK